MSCPRHPRNKKIIKTADHFIQAAYVLQGPFKEGSEQLKCSMYLTEHEWLGRKLFTNPLLRYEKWWISTFSPNAFMGTIPSVGIWRLGRGGGCQRDLILCRPVPSLTFPT